MTEKLRLPPELTRAKKNYGTIFDSEYFALLQKFTHRYGLRPVIDTTATPHNPLITPKQITEAIRDQYSPSTTLKHASFMKSAVRLTMEDPKMHGPFIVRANGDKLLREVFVDIDAAVVWSANLPNGQEYIPAQNGHGSNLSWEAQHIQNRTIANFTQMMIDNRHTATLRYESGPIVASVLT